MMFAGGLSVLAGLATWLGCAVLILFTALGYLQHCKEVAFATATADALGPELEPLIAAAKNANEIRGHLLNLKVSAYSASIQFRSEELGIDRRLRASRNGGGRRLFTRPLSHGFPPPSRLIDLIVWPM